MPGTETAGDGTAPRRFVGTDFTGVSFRDVDLTGATITGLIDGLTVNDVEVAPLIAAELERRHPELALFHSDVPADLARGWRIVHDQLDRTIAKVERLEPSRLTLRVADEWSPLETLRHLVFVADDWCGRTVRGEEQPYWPGGLMPSFLSHPERLGIDPSADPDLDQVRSALDPRVAQLDHAFDKLTAEELARSCPGSYSAGPEHSVTVLGCLQCILDEFSAHCRYIERDLHAVT